MRKYVLGIIKSYTHANSAYDDLIDAGVSSADVSIISKKEVVDSLLQDTRDTGKRIKGTAAAGGVVSGLVGLLAGSDILVINAK